MGDQSFWDIVPQAFWVALAFALGCIVGSFLNVCIHRLPRGESIVSPPSHCPHCQYAIPWYLNIPLVTWLWLGGRCANCKAPISPRYFLVELLTGVAFAACWMNFSDVTGHVSPVLPLVYCLMISGMIAATFIDFEHLIIPDQFTIGGIVAGLFCSLLAPGIHITFPYLARLSGPGAGLLQGALGLAVGAGLIYAVLRLGKLFLGLRKVSLPPGSRVIFTESSLQLPAEEIPYEDIFVRKTDAIETPECRVEMVDRCYLNAAIKLRADHLEVGGDAFDPEEVPCLEATPERIAIPREAMGPADVTFMGAIGSFIGWQGVIFSFMASCFIGSIVGCALVVLNRKDWSSRIPYGPYIAVGAVIWIFGGYRWLSLIFPWFGPGP